MPHKPSPSPQLAEPITVTPQPSETEGEDTVDPTAVARAEAYRRLVQRNLI